MTRGRWPLVPLLVAVSACTPAAPSPHETAIIGDWIGVMSYGGWVGDTFYYAQAGSRSRDTLPWTLRFQADGTFESVYAAEPAIHGSFWFETDTLSPRVGQDPHRLTLSVQLHDLDSLFFPHRFGDTLRLVNAATDSYDHVLVRAGSTR